MSDIDLAVTRSQRLEQRPERDFGATGKGLHPKLSGAPEDGQNLDPLHAAPRPRL